MESLDSVPIGSVQIDPVPTERLIPVASSSAVAQTPLHTAPFGAGKDEAVSAAEATGKLTDNDARWARKELVIGSR